MPRLSLKLIEINLWAILALACFILGLKLGKHPNHKRFSVSKFFTFTNTRNFEIKISESWKILGSLYCFPAHQKYSYWGISFKKKKIKKEKKKSMLPASVSY